MEVGRKQQQQTNKTHVGAETLFGGSAQVACLRSKQLSRFLRAGQNTMGILFFGADIFFIEEQGMCL